MTKKPDANPNDLMIISVYRGNSKTPCDEFEAYRYEMYQKIDDYEDTMKTPDYHMFTATVKE